MSERVAVIGATLLPAPANSDRAFADFPAVNQVGGTEHFRIFYDRALGETGRFACSMVLNRAERDLATVTEWFGHDPAAGGPLDVVLGRLPAGPGATWERADDGSLTLYCDLPLTPQSEPLQASFFLVVLLADLAARGGGWDPALASVLARAVATAVYPRRIAGFGTGWLWLESDRRDLLSGPPPDTAEAQGCATLFVNYLHHQRGFSWAEIVGRSAPTLADLAQRLTGSPDEPARFVALADRFLARGEPSPGAVDNVFPVAEEQPAREDPTASAARPPAGRRVCLLTGASGTLGRYLSERFADRYDFAAVHWRRPPTDGVFAIRADLTADGEPERVVAEALDRFGRLDLVVNAAVSSTWGPMLSSEQLWTSAPQQFLTNVVVPLRIAGAAARLFWADRDEENRAERRNVVNVSSISGQNIYANEGQSVYAASKAALDHLTGHMALEFGAIGVRVNAVAPNSFPSNVPTGRAAQAVVELDDGEATGTIVVVDGAVDRRIQLAPTPVPAAGG